MFPSAVPRGLILAAYTTSKQLCLSHESKQAGAWPAIPEPPSELMNAPSLIVYGDLLSVFVVGVDCKIRHNTQAPVGLWSGWLLLEDGEFQDVNAVVFRDTLYLVARSRANRLYIKNFKESWSDWAEIPGGELSTSAPYPVVANGNLTIFSRGAGDKISFTDFDGENWSGRWYAVRGEFKTNDTPAAVTHNDSLILFARAHTSNRVFFLERNSALDWQPTWTEMPGGLVTIARPSLVITGETLHIYLRGNDNALLHVTRDLTTGKFSEFVKLAGVGPIAQAIDNVFF